MFCMLTLGLSLAYIDPGSGLMLWQVILSVIVGFLFYLKKGPLLMARFMKKVLRRRS